MSVYYFIASMLIATPTAAAAAAEQEQPKAVSYNCELRTIAGDVLGLYLMSIASDDRDLLFIASRDNESWPAKGSSLLALHEKADAHETQYRLSDQHKVRVGKSGPVRNITVWSTEKETVKQPLAFGFCVDFELKNDVKFASPETKPFDLSRRKNGCHLTHLNRPVNRSRFRIDQGAAENGKLQVTFSSSEGDIFADPVTVDLETMANAPKAEHKDIVMGVSRFANNDPDKGPRGMSVFYLDRENAILTSIVRFNTIKGDDGPGFAICSGKITAVEKGAK